MTQLGSVPVRYRVPGIHVWLDEPPEALERRVADRLGVEQDGMGP